MQVDAHSPSFRTLRSYSAKRARSPDTPDSTNRPSKRLPPAVDENLPAEVYLQTEFRSDWRASGNSSRHPSEDWVQQAGGLTIDSPLSGDGSSFPFPNACASGVPDENMTMDADEDDHGSTRSLPHNSQTNTSFIQLTTSNPPQHPSHQEQHPLLASTQHAPCPVPSRSTLLLPSIKVQLATPSDTPVSSDVQNTESTQPITRPSSPTAMSISPTSSWNMNMASTTSRKQRFTMGPRADCQKCLLGVKGHWMHFD